MWPVVKQVHLGLWSFVASTCDNPVVTGTPRSDACLPAGASRLTSWPNVAVCSPAVTGKGDDLGRARRRRPGLSRAKLSDITGVSARTIQRIEAGLSANTANIEKLEQELAPELAAITAEQLATPDGDAGKTLADASTLELAAELMRRLVAEHSHPTSVADGTRPPLYEWRTADYPNEGAGPGAGSPGVAES